MSYTGGNMNPKYPSIQEMIQKLQEAGRTPIVPAPNRWFADPVKHPFQQKMIERVLAQTKQGREGFPSGSYINPQTGEPMDFDIMHDLGVAIDPNTGRPMMSGIKSDLTEIDPKYGSVTKSNLVRKGLFKHEGGDELLKNLAFLATIEKSGKGHHYGLSTHYASPAELVNTMTGKNPTLRPHSRGDIFGVGDEVGRISIQGKHHPVYEKLFVAPAGSDVQGKKLHKAKGGVAHMDKGGKLPRHNFVKHKHGEKIGGYDVGDKIKNYGSYEASGISDIEHGIHKVPMSAFEVTHPNQLFYAKDDIDHVHRLAEQIKKNKYVDPLLVAMDKKGAYVLEGGHRLGAAHLLGMKEIPAIIGHEPDDYKSGGAVHMDRGGRMKPVTKGSTRKFDDNMRGNNIVKETGGNWLGGDVEKQLKKLQMGDTVPKPQIEASKKSIETAKRVTGKNANTDPQIRAMEAELDMQQRNNALNAWMESNLTNYVKKQMGTADDPVRKLAEQDILHMEPYGTREAGSLVMRKRAGLGYPAQGLGKSDRAKFWERLSDASIDSYPAGLYKHGALDESILTNNPWLQNAPDETMINSGKGMARELGFDHIIDVLREDLRAGRIRPEQLSKVSIEHAVRRAHEYNEERKKAMAETALKATEGMPVHKEYPEGYKWIELKAPDYNSLPLEERKQMIARLTEEARQKGVTPEDYIEKYPESQLAEALKYEGDTMGHCVGGYCPDVAEGRSRIFSLRDAKNEPHVTIETRPHQHQSKYESDWFTSQPEELQNQITQKALAEHNAAKNERTPAEDRFTWGKALSKAIREHLGDVPEEIIQIKGKGNAKPKKDYIPFVQDFVKSGNWSHVGDLHNADLNDVKHMTNPTTHQKYLEQGLNVPKYATDKELDALHNEYLKTAEPHNYKPPQNPEQKAQGGTVHMADGGDMDQMQMALMDKKIKKPKKPPTPLHFAPSPALSKKAIEAHAERIVRQMAGQDNPNKKTQQQLEREQNLQVDIRSGGPKSKLPVIDYSKLGKNAFTVGVPGDPSIGGLVPHNEVQENGGIEKPKAGEYLQGIGGEALSREVPMYGGYMYGGYGHPAGWASDLGASRGMFNVVQKLAKEDPTRDIYGHYHKMTPESLNHAVHFLDALMTHSRLHELTDEQRNMLNYLMREVQTTKNKKDRPYASFPGFENPEDVMAHALLSSDMRKKIISTISKDKYLPGGTQRLDDVIFAASHPELRNIETGAGGNSVIKFNPKGKLKESLSSHPTYGHDIPSQTIGQTRYTTPFQLLAPRSYHRAKTQIAAMGKKVDPFNMAKMSIIREPIDEQYINQMGEYENAMRKRLGYKKGGKIKKMADGGQVDVQSIGVNEAPNMDVKVYFPPRPAQGSMLPVGGIQQAQQAPMQPPPPMPNQPQPQQQPSPAPFQVGQPPSNILQMTPQGQAMNAIKPPQMARGGQVDRDTMMLALMNRNKKVKYG